MYINKRIDHATADIVEAGLAMQRTHDDGYALKFMRKLCVSDLVISRILNPLGEHRRRRLEPRRAPLVLVPRQKLHAVSRY